MIDALQERFRGEFIRTAQARIERASSALDAVGNAPTVRNEMHALAGEASLIGFKEVAEAARETEAQAKKAMAGDVRAIAKCARGFRRVRRAVETLASAATESDPKKVLVIDDSALVRDQLTASLTGRKYQVFAAANAGEALAIIRDDVDVILLDYNLGEGDCSTLIVALRQRAPKTHIAIVSGLAGDELSKQAQTVGADSHVSKIDGLDAIADHVATLGKNE